nr:MAG TPA: hypothetical protein [Caudoviricetes sp.]
MSYTVTLYFKNRIDETHFFKKEAEAIECKTWLENTYKNNQSYRVKLEKVE